MDMKFLGVIGFIFLIFIEVRKKKNLVLRTHLSIQPNIVSALRISQAHNSLPSR